MTYIPRICIDFDGVLHEYDAWDTGFGEPGVGGELLLQALQGARQAGLCVLCVFTSRQDLEAVQTWLTAQGLAGSVDEVSNMKLPALAYIDDRAVDATRPLQEILQRLSELTGAQIPQAQAHSGSGREVARLALKLRAAAEESA
jgi:hypothetical protein